LLILLLQIAGNIRQLRSSAEEYSVICVIPFFIKGLYYVYVFTGRIIVKVPLAICQAISCFCF